MKLNAKTLKLLLVISLLTGFLMLPKPAKAVAPNKIIVTPRVSTPASNLNFTVDITIEMFERMNSFQAYLSWNPALFHVSHGEQLKYALGNKTIKEGPFLPNGTQIATYFTAFLNSTLGTLAVWDAQITTEPYTYAVTGNGTLYTVVFEASGTGYCSLHLYDTAILLGTTTFVSHTTVDGQYNYEVYTITRPDMTTSVIFIESNSTQTDFGFNDINMQTFFNVSGSTGVAGYVNVTIPMDLLNVDPSRPPYDWWVMLDNANVTSRIVTTNATHTFIYLAYTQSQHYIRIVGNTVYPEYPVAWLPLLALLAFAITMLLARKSSQSWQSRRGKVQNPSNLT